MRLKTKLFLGCSSILIIMVVFLGVSIRNLNLSNSNIEKSLQERYEKIKVANIAQDELGNISRYIRDLVMLDLNSHDFLQTIDSIQVSRERMESAIDSRMTLAEREGTRKLLQQIRTINHDYIHIQEKCIELASSARKAEAIQVIAEGAETRSEILRLMAELRAIEDTAMADLQESSSAADKQALMFLFISLLISLLVGMGITVWITRRVTGDIHKVTAEMNRVSGIREHVDLPRIAVHSNDEVGEIVTSFNEMVQSLEDHARQGKEFINKIEGQNWLKSGIAEITALCQGVQDLESLAHLLITKIPPLVEANYGTFYNMDMDSQVLRKLATYAGGSMESDCQVIQLGEGLVGQSALENRLIMLDQIPRDYIKITSGLGSASPKSIIISPVAFEEKVVGVIELASLHPFSPLKRELMDEVSKNIGVTINRIEAHMKIGTLLKESQVLTEELQSQSEELQLQQEELKTFNEKLEEEYKDSEKRATELEQMKVTIEEKALQLEESSKYKTEFLANMSHELRTPLNSLLILAQTMIENQEGNLTPRQVEYVKTIFSSGNDLLTLINDILDLSKIEAGKITIHPDVLELSDMMDYVKQYFLPVAGQKKLDFTVQMSENLPKITCLDEHRVLQILKNLLSNAFKFTEQGSVTLRVWRLEEELAFSVIDTGIGVPKYKQNMIFEAFQQANGTTARKYGGTGLGLTISQKMANLMGGFIEIDSVEGKGSTFTLYLPSHPVGLEVSGMSCIEVATTFDDSSSSKGESDDPTPTIVQVVDLANKSEMVENGNARLKGKKILVVDDDMRNVFAVTSALESQKMKALFAENGREGIEVLQKNSDIDLVLMDIMMPEMDGYEALRLIRQIPEYKTLPIIALTAKAMKSDREKCIHAGASDYISKPVNLEQLFSLIKIWLYR